MDCANLHRQTEGCRDGFSEGMTFRCKFLSGKD
jgi:hypothetical protein